MIIIDLRHSNKNVKIGMHSNPLEFKKRPKIVFTRFFFLIQHHLHALVVKMCFPPTWLTKLHNFATRINLFFDSAFLFYSIFFFIIYYSMCLFFQLALEFFFARIKSVSENGLVAVHSIE